MTIHVRGTRIIRSGGVSPSGVSPGGVSPVGGGGGAWPAWRNAMTTLYTVQQINNSSLKYSIDNFGLMFAAPGEEVQNANANLSGICQAWNGWAHLPQGTELFIMCSGGENQYFNASGSIDLGVANPRWEVQRKSISSAQYLNSDHNADLSPVGRHTYSATHGVDGAHLAFAGSDRKDRIMEFAYMAGGGPSPQPYPLNGAGSAPCVDAWRIVDRVFDAPLTWPNTNNAAAYTTGVASGTYNVNPGALVPQARDPRSSDVYFIAGTTDGTFRVCLVKWTAATNKYSVINTTPNYPSGSYTLGAIGQPTHAGHSATIDTQRNEFVIINGFDPGRDSIGAAAKINATHITTGVTRTQNLSIPNLDGYVSGLTYVPDVDRLYFAPSYNAPGPTSPLYSIDPDSGVCTSIGTRPQWTDGDYVCSRFSFMDALGGVAMGISNAHPIYFIPTRSAP